MAIDYALFPNHVTADPDDYMAVIQAGDSTGLEDVAKAIAMGGSLVGEAEILVVLNKLVPVIAGMLAGGRRVQLGGLAEFFPRVRGVFNSQTDTFDASRNQIDVGANPGSSLRRTIGGCEKMGLAPSRHMCVSQGISIVPRCLSQFFPSVAVTKDEAIPPSPNPLEVFDLISNTVNDQITAAGAARLVGNRLKFDPATNDEGVFFVDSEESGETQAAMFLENKPSQLVFQVPTLVPGSHTIEVRTWPHGSTTLRTGQSDTALSVV